jgi:uncharacterized protein (TIGR00255 family)
MLKSMTGFGKDSFDVRGKALTVEIRTLNSRQADVYLRTPLIYREKDIEIRTLLTEKLERGKIDMTMTIENTGESVFSINRPLIKKYYEELEAVASEMGLEVSESLLPAIVRLPDVVYPERELLDDSEWDEVRQGILKVTAMVDAFRVTEGTVMEKDIAMRMTMILDSLAGIEKIEKSRTDYIRERLIRDFKQLAGEVTVDKDRFEQEIIYYLEKLDITEEMVRLKEHCSHFTETMAARGAQGRKLGFITQEIGREINTIGSKANNADIQKLVVNMKDELEKIKEQLLNIL